MRRLLDGLLAGLGALGAALATLAGASPRPIPEFKPRPISADYVALHGDYLRVEGDLRRAASRLWKRHG